MSTQSISEAGANRRFGLAAIRFGRRILLHPTGRNVSATDDASGS
jgi:hypothetical protein